MNELEVWICDCKTERTWGARTNEPHPHPAWLICQKCERMTLHVFTGKYRMLNAYKYATTADGLCGDQPARKWKKASQSAHKFGWSNARLGNHYAQERH